MIPRKDTTKRIFNEKDLKYAYIPVDVDDEPILTNYTGRYKKNESCSKHSLNRSQISISHNANNDKIDRPNPVSNSWTTIPRGWDVFRLLPPPPDNLNRESPINQIELLPMHVVKWIWSIYISLCIPELQCFIGCIHRIFFRNVKKPTFMQFVTVFIVETLNAIGVGILVFRILPNLDAITGAMLTNFVCFVPSILLLLSRRSNRLAILFIAVDIVCIIVQIIALWSLSNLNVSLRKYTFILPFCLILISLGWWQNFVHIESALRPIRVLAQFAVQLNERRSKTYAFISIWKCIIYCFTIFLISTNGITSKDLFENDPFGEKLLTITARHLNQTQISKLYDRIKMEIANYNDNDEILTLNDLNFVGMRIAKPLLVLKNHDSSNLINDWNNNHNSRFFSDHSQSMHRKSSLSSTLSPEIELAQRINKQIGRNKTIHLASTESNESVKNSIGNSIGNEFEKFSRNRKKRTIDDDEYKIPPNIYNIYNDYVELNQYTTSYDALWIVFVQAIAVMLTYYTSKFACKVMLQRTCFALPVMISVPATVISLFTMCKNGKPIFELFWRCDTTKSLSEFFLSPLTQIWIAILMVQLWITLHLWRPRHERLAKTAKRNFLDRLGVQSKGSRDGKGFSRSSSDVDRVEMFILLLDRVEILFILPYNSALFTDQCLALNRRCDDKTKIRTEDLDFDTDDLSTRNINVGLTYAKSTTALDSIGSTGKVIETAMIKEMASSADAVTKIYVCATMWHETAIEMTCMLKSVFRLDEDQCARRNAQKYLKIIDPDYYEFEAHIFFDDAFDINEYGEPVINKYVKQLIDKIDEAASALHQTDMRLRPPKKISTPYGGRLNYIMPGKNRLMIHLKDKQKFAFENAGVMYLYYLLGYQLMMKVDDEIRKETISENTFILTLDGDVDFSPQCVHLLVDLMKKDRRLGAACGRIHPRGSGLMIWYQKFEYAIGHWLQKATEHMIGCVLCSPGCFSLFRSLALMDDNVIRRYASKAENPLDFIQYDQGEDPSDALTYAPESFNEFFNQRRRWIPSTLANIIDLLRDYKNVYNISMYNASFIRSWSGDNFLMVVGALSISFKIDASLSLFIVTLPVATFCLMCFISDSERQLIAAQIIGALFAMLMTAVIVGTMIQMQKDGIMSPHSIFLFFVIGSFFTAAILHPLEFTCITPGILYFLAIPCMYMLLPIYSLCNLNNIAWEHEKIQKMKKLIVVDANDIARQKHGKHVDLISINEMDSEISIGCGTACRLICCLRDKSTEITQIWQLSEKINAMIDKLDQVERQPVNTSSTRTVYAIASENNSESSKWENNLMKDDYTKTDNHNINDRSVAVIRDRKWNSKINEVWLNDKRFRGVEKDSLDSDEEVFWNDVINKYLTPIIHDQLEQNYIRTGLMQLRNKVCSGFFIVNTIFIIVVLLLQLQKDCIHIEWPLGPRYNHTIIPCSMDIRQPIWVVTRLQLEPIGLVFLLFFISILIIQFTAMLLHRFGTMAHIIASTQLFCWHRHMDHLTEDELVVQNAVEIARELQAIRGIDEPVENTPSVYFTLKRRPPQSNYPPYNVLGIYILIRVIEPFIPHLAESLWQEIGGKGMLHLQPWPEVAKSLLIDKIVTVAVQINRKLKAIIKSTLAHRSDPDLLEGACEGSLACSTCHEEQAISRRKIVRNLESSKCSMYRPKTETLDAAFRKRFFALSSKQAIDRSNSERRLTLRRNTIRAIERRRNSIFGSRQPNENEATSLVDDQRFLSNDGNRNATRRNNLQHLFDNPLNSSGNQK
ncbi:Chitin synthase 1 [Dirofilaria immitis]|nr:Chitin synthase 1 [Dirofilaria immitis]